MAIALVQVKTATGTSGSPNLTLTSASTAGNLLVAFCDTGQNSGNPTLTPPANWTAETELVNQTFVFRNGLVAYYANNPGGISSITITASPAVSGGGWCLYVFEFSGVATTTPLDQEAQKVNLSGGGTATPSESITTTVAGDLVIGWAAGDAANGCSSWTGPAGWTTEASIADVDGFERATASYQVQASAGSITYQPTSGGVTDYIIAIIAFKAASGGGGSTPITYSDTGAGADAESITASLPLAESGHGADALASLSAQVPLSETGAGVDALASLSAQVSLADTSNAAVDTLAALSVTLSLTDTATGADAITLNTPITFTDAATGTDTLLSLLASLPLADTAAAADAVAALTATLAVADTGTGSEMFIVPGASQPGLVKNPTTAALYPVTATTAALAGVTASTTAATFVTATTAALAGVTASTTAATFVTAGDV